MFEPTRNDEKKEFSMVSLACTLNRVIRYRPFFAAAILPLALAGCAIPPMYQPSGTPASHARLRVKLMDMFAYPALSIVYVENDAEPKQQVLAAYQKPWMGIGKSPKESETIGIPASTDRDTNMPVLERYVTSGAPLRLYSKAILDGYTVCDSRAAFTPMAGHDYELVLSLVSTSIGGNGRCGLLAYELVPGAGNDNRVPLVLQPLDAPKR